MAEEKDESTTNPCCTLWKDRFLKLQQKLKKAEEGRAFLKEAVKVYEGQCDKVQAECLKFKTAYEEEKMKSNCERMDKEKEKAARIVLENEISSLKSENLLLTQKGGSVPQHMDEELLHLRERILESEKEINCLREQLQMKCNTDQELSNLRAQLLNVETEKKHLKKDLQKEKARADSEKKRADQVLKTAKSEQTEVKALKNEKNTMNDLSSLKSKNQNLEAEISRLKELLDKEKKRAQSETKIAETEKRNANKVKEMLKAEQSRVEEHIKLVDAERKKAEEFSHQLQKLKCEADEVRSKLVSESSKIKEANKKKLESERKKVIKEKKKAEEQQKIAEMSTKHALEEKHRADSFKQQLEEYQKKYVSLKKDMEELKIGNCGQVNQNTNQVRNGSRLDIEREAELKKAVEMYKLQALAEKSRADELAQKLEITQKRTRNATKEIQDLVPSKSLMNPIMDAEMKLLKKRLKLEKARVKHGNQVAEHEKKCKETVEEELHQLKLEFARFSNRVGLCSCLAICNEGKSCMEKSGNMNSKRKYMHPESRIELMKPTCAATKSSEYCKTSLPSPALSLPISGTCTESTSGTASKLEPLLGGSNRKNLDSSALVSSMSSFSDRQLVGAQGNCHFSYSKENSNLQLPSIDNIVKSPLGVKNKEGNTRKRKRLNAIESNEHLYVEGETLHAKIAKNISALHGISGLNDKPLKEGTPIDQNEEQGIRIVRGEDGVKATHTHNNDLNTFNRMFDVDYMKLLNLDSEIDEDRYRAAVERPLSPTLPNVEFEMIQSDDLDDCRPSVANNMSTVEPYGDTSEIPGIVGSDNHACIYQDQESIAVTGTSYLGHKGAKIYGNGSRSACDDSGQCVVVFPEFRDSGSLAKIFHITKTFTDRCCAFSQSDYAFKNVLSAFSTDEILSPKEMVCLFFTLFIKSFSGIALTNFNNIRDGSFMNCLDIFSGQLRKVMCDIETRKIFTEVVDLDELITLIQDFICNKRVLFWIDTKSETLSLPDYKASLHQLVLGAALLASICAAFDRIDSICEALCVISDITSSSTLTSLHVFAYVCGEKLLNHGDYNLLMTVIKSLVTYCERENLSSGFAPCAKCPFSDCAVSMEELASLLLKKVSGYCTHKHMMSTHELITVADDTLSNLRDVLSLLELLASNMRWGWVCENIISQLLGLVEVCALETPLAAVFVLLGQLARLGIDANGFEDTQVENIRVKLSSFISQNTSYKIGSPIQFAAVNALLGTMPSHSFQEICKNSLELLPHVISPTATSSIQKWFSLLSDEQKSLSVRLLTVDVS
uniref:uncharacterized protein LOC122580067 n=1 Tax=Erigeron canadensis TaxID=72917 RepID=UPI001CB8F5B1|nr:uncharacterized protein LOC122580067 [Erigeron canadensis]